MLAWLRMVEGKRLIPIYEQGEGRGIGHSLESFLKRFTEICSSAAERHGIGRFAVILYDFHDNEFRRVLRDHGVFTKLDRLARENLHVFYMDVSGRDGLDRFNVAMTQHLQLDRKVDFPAVAFFDYQSGNVDNVAVVELEHTDIVHAFSELYEVIGTRLANAPRPRAESKLIRTMASTAKFLSKEAVRAWIRAGMGHLPF